VSPLRTLILAAAGSDTIRRAVATAPLSRGLVRRFVAGETTEDAVRVASGLVSERFAVTLDYLGEDTADHSRAEQTVLAYLELIDRLKQEKIAEWAEISVKLSAVGQALAEGLALENAARICDAAGQCDMPVTLDMEDHTTIDSTLHVLHELRRTWPRVGAVLQAYLRRTLQDCRDLAGRDSRVRLCKGAYAAPPNVAFAEPHDVARNYVRCANVLLAGEGYPQFATHDPRLVEIIGERARWYHRSPDSYEYQMLYGVRPDEQRRLAAAGTTVRVYVPYGRDWYGYLMRRLAERPANTAFFLRSLLTRS
jgi:proline dehydrogenase